MSTNIFKLSNGLEIPSIGYGTYLVEKEITAKVVEQAISAGYRHIDTAAIYGNERAVGEGIRNSGIGRENIFVTSKLWNSERGFDKTLAAFEATLNELQMDYLDLYLIHWPANTKQFDNWAEINADTWKALEKLYKDGKVKSIGVSNFDKKHLEQLVQTAEILPMVNQIEVNAGHQNTENVAYSKELGIVVEAWAALGQSRILNNETVQEVAEKYGKTAAQILVKWLLQHEILPLVKSVKESRIKENFDIYDFELSPADLELIGSIPAQGFTGLHPDEVDF
ncbi:aldo/keto reductase [Pedobacter sp. AW1-32]|uniref:aldo/keto reductase n=1 Tax=Pedobacter sp. AW1-32 TaxID=3383026 RepID=UPI003FF0BD95